jgi:hypothetical protein
MLLCKTSRWERREEERRFKTEMEVIENEKAGLWGQTDRVITSPYGQLA